MYKPDLEMVHAEAGRVYYHGRIYDLTHMASGWTLSRSSIIVHEAETIEDCCSWLMAQSVA